MNPLILRAIDPSCNMDRLYELSLQRGIVSSWCVIIRNARYGKAGQQRIYAFPCMKEAMCFMSKKIKQKLNNKYKLNY